MSTVAQPVHLRRPRRGPAPGLLALALVPGAASRIDAVPAIDAWAAQTRLVALGLLTASAATGSWNRATVDAVRRFQAERGLDTSGVAGATTAARLLDA